MRRLQQTGQETGVRQQVRSFLLQKVLQTLQLETTRVTQIKHIPMFRPLI
jgi:hypothetical protein